MAHDSNQLTEESRDGNDFLILVVEDDPVVNELLSTVLGRQHRVASAFDGQEGLEKALALSPDLILIDIMMPGMGGDELVQELRRRPAFDEVPLVVLTAMTDEALRLSLLKSDIQEFWYKPFDTDEMLIRLENLLNHRRRSLERRRGLEQRLRSYMETSPLGIIELDADFRVIYWSPRSREMFGWSSDEVIGKSPEEWGFIDPADLETFAHIRESLLSGETPEPVYTLHNRHKNGSILYCQWYNSVLSNEAGKPRSILAQVHDITRSRQVELELQLRIQQQQAEEQIRASQELLDSVLNSSPDAIVALDPIRAETGEIIDFYLTLVNAKAAQLNQMAIEEMVGSRLLERSPGIARSGLFGHYVQVVETGQPFQGEIFYDYDHIRGWFDLIAVKQGRGLAVTIRDITRRKADQESIRHLNQILARRAAELEQINEELKKFSYSISHDLRAPLRAVSGFAQIIQRRYSQDLNEEARHYLDNIIMAGKYMDQLITDLLVYTRLGREPVQREKIDLTALISRIKEDYAGQLKATQGTLGVPPEIPPVRGDRTLLYRLFANLIDNALKYHRPDLPPQVLLEYRVEDDRLVVSLQDNGIGIAPEHHQQIFNPFQRLHSLEDYPGTGIGLAIVKRSIQLMEGEIWLESAPDEGTTFYINLPLA